MKSVHRSIVRAACVAGACATSVLIFLLGETSPFPSRPLPVDLAGAVTILFALGGIGFLAIAAPALSEDAPDPRGTAARRAPGSHTTAAICLVLVGFTLRIAHLANYGYCNDEVLFVHAAGHETLSETLHQALIHFHPPTNFILLHYILKITWLPFWVRMPSVIGGTLAIYFTYLFVRSLFGATAGLISAFLVTFSPNLILLSQVCRNYSPSLPFVLLSLYFAAEYFRTGDHRKLYGFALFEFLSVIWHYGLLPAFLGVNLAVFAHLAWSRTDPLKILKFVSAQIPVAVVYLLAIFVQLPSTQQGQQSKVVAYMADEFTLSLSNPLKPLLALFQYLIADAPGLRYFLLSALFFVAAVAGAVALWRKGRVWQVVLCMGFLPFAYLFAFGIQKLPFGGTRHSFYAFPFLFALIGGAGALCALGTRQFEDINSAPSGSGVRFLPTGPSRFSVGVVWAVCGLFLFSSLKLYAYVAPYYFRQSPANQELQAYYKGKFYKVAELPTRVDDLELLRNAILKDSSPGDVVMTSLPVMMILRAYLEEHPKAVDFDIKQTLEFDWKGRRFFYIPEAYFGFLPEELVVAVKALADRLEMSDEDRVWIALAGWEVWPYSLSGWTEKAYPGTIEPSSAVQDSHDTFFAVRVGRARGWAEQVDAKRKDP